MEYHVNEPGEVYGETWPATAASVDSATATCGRTHPRRVKPRRVRRGFMGVAGWNDAAAAGGSDVQVDGLLG